MKFKTLSEYFQRIEDTSSRLGMTDILAEVFKKAKGDEAAMIAYLIGGRVSPMFIPAEYNVSTKTILKVLEGCVGAGRGATGGAEKVLKKYKELGDLGLVAEQIVRNEAEKVMSVSDVYALLWQICLTSGSRSVEIRAQKIMSGLARMCSVEAKFFVRILAQTLRLGSSSKTVLDALSVAVRGDKSEREEIERAYGVCSDLGHVAKVYLESGMTGLKKISIVPGVPVFSMLVEREKDFEQIMKRIPEALVQPKFDGIRCQIHIGVESDRNYADRFWWKYWSEREKPQAGLFADGVSAGNVKLFSRNLEDMTGMFPEIVEAASKLKVNSAILDAEVIGYEEEAQEYAKFQETMTRKRKYNIVSAVKDVPVTAFVFDVLMLDGESLVSETNKARIDMVGEIVSGVGLIRPASTWVASSANGLLKLFEENVSAGLEGVIIKDPASTYKPGKRGFDWIKMKRASQGHLADTVDVVIIGYYSGRGRHAGLGVGALLGAVYDSESDTFVTVTKIGTGITDERWEMIKRDLDGIKLAEAPKRVQVEKALLPDQWVAPKIVAAVEADEITRSPVHTAGKSKEGIGYALRFPRLKDWGRDKSPEDATTVKELVEMYERQTIGKPGGA